MLYELQSLFSVKLFERIVTFVELESNWKEVVDACFRHCSGICLEGLSRTTENISQDGSILAKTWTGHLPNPSQKCKISASAMM